MSGRLLVPRVHYLAAHSQARAYKVAMQLLQQKEMRERLAGVEAGKAWNADMAARKAAKGGKP